MAVLRVEGTYSIHCRLQASGFDEEQLAQFNNKIAAITRHRPRTARPPPRRRTGTPQGTRWRTCGRLPHRPRWRWRGSRRRRARRCRGRSRQRARRGRPPRCTRRSTAPRSRRPAARTGADALLVSEAASATEPRSVRFSPRLAAQSIGSRRGSAHRQYTSRSSGMGRTRPRRSKRLGGPAARGPPRRSAPGDSAR